MHDAPGTVLVVGSANVDLVAYVERVPEAGETVMGTGFEVFMGGKGANQAVMAARLGARVAFAGCVGDDDHGAAIRANLVAEGVGVAALGSVPGPSGAAPIWVDRHGANRIVVVAGANDAVTPARAEAAVAAIDDLAVVVGQLEVPPAATFAAFAAARRRGAVTVWNPAPARPVAAELLGRCDWVVPNETELAVLAGIVGRPAPDPADDGAVAALAAALGTGLVVTRGEAGALVCGPGGGGGPGGPVRVPAPVVDVVDTTGAGDAFVGAFAVGLARGRPPVAAARLATACASASVGRRGAQASYPRLGDLGDLGDADAGRDGDPWPDSSPTRH